VLYRFGVYREAHILQSASEVISDLLRWTVLGGMTLVVVFTAGAIAADRGTLADSVLSRGISRYQYFWAKLHARLISVLGTYLALSCVVLVSCHFLLHEELTFWGSLAAVGSVGAILVAVVACGVAVSALSGHSAVSITVLWVALYGLGFLLSLMPAKYLTPDRLLAQLPKVLRGVYDPDALSRLTGQALLVAAVVSLIGLIGFSRSDV